MTQTPSTAESSLPAQSHPAVQPARPASSSRDWRIDFWRGLAIVFIFWNHSVNNVMSWFTTKYFGLSDSAELFVFLSGFAIASMYAAKFSVRPVMAIPYSIGRAFTLYLHHIAAFVVIATLSVLYRDYVGSSVMERDLFIRPFLIATETVLPKLATLAYLPPLLDILPLYILLTLLSGLLFYAFRDRWMFYVGFAIVVWSFAWATGTTLSSYPDTRHWTFNPLAWQAVFLAGFVMFFIRDEPWLRSLVASPAVIALSITILIVGFFAAAPWANLGLLEWRPLTFLTDAADKAYASPIRLIHFLAMAHIAVLLLTKEMRIDRTFLGRCMVLIGRKSLPMFVISTVFAAMTHGLFDLFQHSVVVQVVYSIGMAAVLVGLAHVADSLGRASRGGPPSSATPTSAPPKPKAEPPARQGAPLSPGVSVAAPQRL
jgi:hypothetical protein